MFATNASKTGPVNRSRMEILWKRGDRHKDMIEAEGVDGEEEDEAGRGA